MARTRYPQSLTSKAHSLILALVWRIEYDGAPKRKACYELAPSFGLSPSYVIFRLMPSPVAKQEYRRLKRLFMLRRPSEIRDLYLA